MKLISYRSDGRTVAGILDGDAVIPAGRSVLDARPAGSPIPLADVTLEAPLVPGKIVCVGLNYRDHAAESGAAIPASPVLFAKFANTIIGPGAPIRIPPITSQVDYEAELAVVIGRRASVVAVEDALDYVLGYTCANDVSARDLQFADQQWVRGKTLDTFCPLGPCIVTTDEIQDPQALGIRCVVNGETLQDSSTSQMIFPVGELVSVISQGITLEPGDVILTGTPHGVGFARRPPVLLRPGDVVSVEIDGIGTLTNPVRARREAPGGSG